MAEIYVEYSDSTRRQTAYRFTSTVFIKIDTYADISI